MLAGFGGGRGGFGMPGPFRGGMPNRGAPRGRGMPPSRPPMRGGPQPGGFMPHIAPP
jgi:hypothetical protein